MGLAQVVEICNGLHMREPIGEGTAQAMFGGELSPEVQEQFMRVHRVLFGADEVPSCLKNSTPVSSEAEGSEQSQDQTSDAD